MISLRSIILAAGFVGLVAGAAVAEDLPASAQKATMEEFKALADGKPVTVEIFDAGKPITATLTWSWTAMTITGNASVDGKKIKVKTVLSIDGDMACSKGEGDAQPSCHAIYIDGDTFYEVNADGTVHAKSTLKP